ncbi:hypothetical protein BOX15_Mlig003206g1 [Macrostomum lignano]|uniref:Uncharacterized protein n=1 Tax=Macrostomum lignano TaxID=282301 RepID=A0A267G4M1_9PLAT|nr:hypothetical protein BOX15_Mlig003206g1 [Macrostomum lignano]
MKNSKDMNKAVFEAPHDATLDQPAGSSDREKIIATSVEDTKAETSKMETLENVCCCIHICLACLECGLDIANLFKS